MAKMQSPDPAQTKSSIMPHKIHARYIQKKYCEPRNLEERGPALCCCELGRMPDNRQDLPQNILLCRKCLLEPYLTWGLKLNIVIEGKRRHIYCLILDVYVSDG